MAEADALTHAFMRTRPAEAARVLEAVPADQAAALFARVPSHVGAPVLAAMVPSIAARTAAELDDARALELLGLLGTLQIVSLLRHLPELRRKKLLAGLPTAPALASTLLLGYPEHSVGAWSDPNVIAQPGATPIHEVLERVRLGDASNDWIFVTDAAQQLSGWAALSALLRAPAQARLDTVARPCEATLAAHAPLEGAREHPGWRSHSVLPVVEPGNKLIGVLTHAALLRAMAESERPAGNPEDRVTTVLAHAYWNALSGIVEAATGLLPRVGPLGGETRREG